jgi:uridine kinase
MADVKAYNFDHPDAFDQAALLECIEDLKAGKPVDVPIYDFNTHQRSADSK